MRERRRTRQLYLLAATAGDCHAAASAQNSATVAFPAMGIGALCFAVLPRCRALRRVCMDDQKLQQLLAHEDWRAQFEPSMLHRGLAIMRAGDVRVLGHEITGNGDDLLLGMVGRSATSPYFCDVVVHEHREDVTIRFTCSCQRQTPCEHLAAL